MRKDITIPAEPRDSRGKNEARRLRAKGSLPAILYGVTASPEPVAVSPKDVSRILNSKTGHNTIFNLNVAGKENTPVMIIDWQYDPIKDNLLHVDMKRIDLTKRVQVLVPVVAHGEPKGVKQQGGLLETITREIEVECLPDDIPEEFLLDVSEMMLGDSVRASDVAMTGSLKLLSPPESVLVHVVAPKAEVVAEPVAEVVAEVAPAEPEVAKKGKKEVEGAEEGKDSKKKK